ncbi:MAG TPA: glycoside hydrolase family 38 C-terminal domain-containing protein [Mycobacteriales bacterium]|nr:glycoside hydrolase family 38 C-terminal domain-containing protein [Mycobacteriales bacterium]
MHDDRQLVEGRLKRAVEQWIKPAIYSARAPLSVEAWHVPGEPVPVAEALAATYEPFELGTLWGPPWSTTWFKITGEVPADWAGRKVEAVFDIGFGGGTGFSSEAMAYTPEGSPIKAIHPMNRYVPIGAPAGGGERVDLLLEAAANPGIMDGYTASNVSDITTAHHNPLFTFASADVAVLDETVFHLALDIEVLEGVMLELPLDLPRRHEILRALERMLDTLDLHDVAGTAAAGREQLAEVLAKPAYASAHKVSAAGHAHIDTAWLWPIRETKRKIGRTFANVTLLAKEYPELVFACSQAQQYAWVKELYPEIWDRIKESIADGNWAPVGSQWIEPDGNLPGGEAMARQLIHGKRFFSEELDVETKGIWLPDSFGYTAAFPQLAKLAGVEWFLTQKISWNQTNTFPHHTLWWEGIDGSRIFTHFPPMDTYNSMLSPAEMFRAQRNYAEKGVGTTSLAPFGYGDGGGGPTREMLERARRMRDLEGSPTVVIEHPDEFFRKARAEYEDAPVWSGELYLELHRGTFTTQAKTKAGNRKSEHALREAELWATQAAVSTGADYPYDELDRLWKDVLLNQFHDILPGSSIGWVHRETREQYEEVLGALEEVIDRASGPFGGDGGIGVLNAGPLPRNEVVAVPLELAATAEVTQKLSDGSVAAWASAPALGVGAAAPDLPTDQAPVMVDAHTLDNGLLRVSVDDNGLVTSVRDLVADREVLAPGAIGNLLQLHPDHPNHWDAWDIDRHYFNTWTDLTEADSVEVTENGPLYGAISVKRSFGSSQLTQKLILRAGSARLDIETDVDWQESEKVLKAAFPIDVHAEQESAEIQFGHVHRPTHTNTSWEHAKFEIFNHRWVHVGEPGYGVAIVNDAKYGHDVSRTTRSDGGTTTTVRLTLLRAPAMPDPTADRDQHHFTYAIRPGAEISDAIAEGYALNLPLRTLRTSAAPAPLVAVDNPAIIVEAVKLADDRSGDVIVRLYEAHGGRAAGTVTAGFPVASAGVVDLLERPVADAELDGNAVSLAVRPFQIVTLRLKRA